MTATISPRRSLIFTPANRPTLFAKSATSGADMICIDLEDAVAADQKAAARADALKFLLQDSGTAPERIVRINQPNTPIGKEDFISAIEKDHIAGTILIPKVESAEEIQDLQKQITAKKSSLRLAIMIETILGIENCFEILKNNPGLDFAMFGGADLAAELGTAVAPEPLAYGRSRLIYAAKHAHVDVLDMPCLNFKDAEQVKVETTSAKALGFTGKAVIHPDNINVVNQTFTPTKADLELAQRFVKAYQESKTGVAVVDGRLVEKPVVHAMELILARGRAAGLIP
ncbi:MAG: CoA ester lyase [Gammaproteobacteria bacterium]|nr:CoA ester lyase [Gammaproteobacteria bacterium]